MRIKERNDERIDDETKMRNYNTKEGIAEYLVSLDGLTQLAKDRMEAGYTRKEQDLKEFCILGGWHLDRCGNTMKIVEGQPRQTLLACPAVLTMEEMFSLLKTVTGQEASITSSLMARDIPSSENRCLVCEAGWTIKDCYDSFTHIIDGIDGQESVLFHDQCWKAYLHRKTFDTFRKAFDDAGFQYAELTAIENEYTRGSWGGPWFLVRHPLFGEMKVGWRKRVIHLSWEGYPDPNYTHSIESLFPKEDVTKAPNYIHAWGVEKLVEYLSAIHKHLKSSWWK